MNAAVMTRGHEIDRAIDALLFQQCPDDFDSWWKLMGDAIAEGVPKGTIRTWSESGGDNFDERAFESQYSSLSNRPSTGRTGMLFKKARDAGWVDRNPGKRPCAADLEARKKLAAKVEAQAAAKRAERQAKAEAKAAELINGAGLPDPGLPQLGGKGVKAHGDLRLLPEFELRYVDEKTGEWCSHVERGVVAVPIRTERNRITSLQLLFTSKNNPIGKNKYFLPGGRTAGGYFVLGKVEKTTTEVVISESYTTSASVFEALEEHKEGGASTIPVMTAFGAGNLEAVAKDVREKLGDGVKIIIAADNDQWKARNTGVEAAMAAARAVGGYVAIPPFEPKDQTGIDDEGRPTGPTDWNDWHLKNGLENVAFHIRKAIEAGPFVVEHVEAAAEQVTAVDALVTNAGSGEQTQEPEQTEVAPAKKRRDHGDTPVYSQKTPLKTARGMIDRIWCKDGDRTIHRSGRSYFTWHGTHYVEADDEAVRSQIYHHLENARCFVRDKDGDSGAGTLSPFNPDSASVSKVEDALCAAAQLPGSRPEECWLDDRARPAAKEVISVANGLLHMPSRELLPHDPAFFTLNSLPFDYNPDALEPVEWLKFLDGLWPGDPDSIALLQRWMGYLLSASTSQQKMMLLIGPPRSGKGTIMRVMKALLGEANVAGPRLSAFANNFGLEPLIGKRAAIVGDARLSGKIDQGEIVGSLLSITGEDTLTVDRKNRAAWSGVLPVRITICTNEMPRLQDASGALASRFLILQMERSFLGQEDHGLGERIESELPGILKWALDGWDALQHEGRFPEPAASKAAIGALGELSSPIRAFVADKCELDPAASTPCQDMFDAWQVWCKLQGRDHPGSLQSFGRDLAAAVAGLKVSQPRNADGPRRRVYEGIRLRDSNASNVHTLSFFWDEDGLQFIPVVDGRAGLGSDITFDDHIRMTAPSVMALSARLHPANEDYSQPPL